VDCLLLPASERDFYGLKHQARRRLQCFRDAKQHRQTRFLDPAFQVADVGSICIAAERQFFLGKTLRRPQLLQNLTKGFGLPASDGPRFGTRSL